MFSIRIFAATLVVAAGYLAAESSAQACDQRIAGSCVVAPAAEPAKPDAAAQNKPAAGRTETRRPARAGRSYKRYRYSRKRSRSAFRSGRHYRSASRRSFRTARPVMPVKRPASELSDTVGAAPRAETDNRASLPASNGLNAADSFVVHVRKSITLPMPVAQGAVPAVVEQVRTATPPPAPTPVQVAAATSQAEPENTGVYVGMPTQPAMPVSDNDVTLLRAAFMVFAGLLTLATAVRLVIG